MEPTDNLQAKDRVDRISSTEFGQISILSSEYTFKLDSGDEEIIQAHKYPQERVDEGHQVGFALFSDRSTWWVWQREPWQMVGGVLKISFNCAGNGGLH
jgi:hypothetical protein